MEKYSTLGGTPGGTLVAVVGLGSTPHTQAG